MSDAMSRWWDLVFIGYETLTDLFMEAGLTGVMLLGLKRVALDHEPLPRALCLAG
jgi:hypothetical protein